MIALGKMWIYSLQSKYTTFIIINNGKLWLKLEFIKKFKKLRTRNGLEYYNDEIKNYSSVWMG